MKGKREHEALFELAAADLILVAKNLGDPEIRPQLLFFHLQQAVEKFLKSLLSFYGQRFPRIHDIAELIVLCRKAGIELPEWIEELIGLTPFAVDCDMVFLQMRFLIYPIFSSVFLNLRNSWRKKLE